MVETPTATVIEETVTYNDEPDAPIEKKEEAGMDVEQTITVIPVKPITSKIRTTLAHLKSESGKLSRWRGLKQAFVYNVLGGLMLSFMHALLPFGIGGRMLGKILTTIALSPVHAALTHKIIAKDSAQRSKTLSAPFKTIKYLWAPNAFAAAAEECMLVLFRLNHIAVRTGDAGIPVWAKVGIITTAAIFYFLFVVIPAQIGLTRVEAAFLPEDEDTIVPFDRTFGGKTFTTELGGYERLMAKTAVKSADWEVVRRVLKLYAKITIITVALVLIGVHVVGFEMWAIMGEAMKTLAMSGKAQLQQRGLF